MATDARDIERMANALEGEGFVIVRDVVSTDALARLDLAIREAYEEAKRVGTLFKGGGNISGHLNCYPGEQSRFVLEDLRARGLLEVIARVSPDGLGALRANCNVNLPGSVAQHYHMDGYFSTPFYICTVAVIDTSLENGALDVLPGTNRRFYKFWQYALKRLYRRSTRVPLSQGDVVVRKSTTWHRGMPNRTTTLRPQLTFTFGEPGAPDGDAFGVNDGKIYFEPNWFKTDRIGQLREWVFVTVPFSYSAYRFVRSLVGNKGYAPEKRFGDFSERVPRRFSPSRLRGARP